MRDFSADSSTTCGPRTGSIRTRNRSVRPIRHSKPPAPLSGVNIAATTIQFADPKLKTAYSSQANLTIERQLGKDMVLTGSFITSRGIHLLGTYDLNAPIPTNTYTYAITDVSGNPVSTFTTPIYQNPRP